MVEAVPEDPTAGEVAEPNVYEQSGQKEDFFSDVKALHFSVRDPQDFSGHIVFVVKG